MPNVNDSLQFLSNFLGVIAGVIAVVLVVATRRAQPGQIRREVDNEFERQLADDVPATSASGSRLPRAGADPSRTYLNQRFQRVREDLRKEFERSVGTVSARVDELERDLGVDELRQARDTSERAMRVLDDYRTAKEDFSRASALVGEHTDSVATLTLDVGLLKRKLAELERALTDLRKGIGAPELVHGLLQEMARIIIGSVAPVSVPEPGASAYDGAGRTTATDTIVEERIIPQDLAELEREEPDWPQS